MGESNPRPRFGKPILYHLTNPAFVAHLCASDVILSRLFRARNFEHRVKIVLFRNLITPYKTTFLTPMYQIVLPHYPLYPDRFHHSPAHLESVPWVFINVLTPEALPTMIGKTSARIFCATMLTYKVFNRLFKRHSLWLYAYMVGAPGFEPGVT